MLFMLLTILPYFLLQIFFPCFPPLKARCVLWSEKYGSYFLEAQHMKEMEISNKNLLKTCFVSRIPTWCFTFMSRLIFIATCVG